MFEEECIKHIVKLIVLACKSVVQRKAIRGVDRWMYKAEQSLSQFLIFFCNLATSGWLYMVLLGRRS